MRGDVLLTLMGYFKILIPADTFWGLREVKSYRCMKKKKKSVASDLFHYLRPFPKINATLSAVLKRIVRLCTCIVWSYMWWEFQALSHRTALQEARRAYSQVRITDEQPCVAAKQINLHSVSETVHRLISGIFKSQIKPPNLRLD